MPAPAGAALLAPSSARLRACSKREFDAGWRKHCMAVFGVLPYRAIHEGKKMSLHAALNHVSGYQYDSSSDTLLAYFDL